MRGRRCLYIAAGLENGVSGLEKGWCGQRARKSWQDAPKSALSLTLRDFQHPAMMLHLYPLLIGINSVNQELLYQRNRLDYEVQASPFPAHV